LKIVEGENCGITLEGLPPGLHSLYAIATVGGQQEISRPVTVLVQTGK